MKTRGIYCRFRLKVLPAASCNRLEGWLGEELKVRIQAPPKKGKANLALLQFLSSCVLVPPSQLSLAGGKSSQRKTVIVDGLSEAEVRARLNGLMT